MEYLHDRGLFDDLPYQSLAADMLATYPRLVAAAGVPIPGTFETDAIQQGR
jgi:hypothetical protein